MDSISTTKPVIKKKDESPSAVTGFIAAVREGLSAKKERRARPSNMTDAHLQKIRQQRIKNALDRSNAFLAAGEKDRAKKFDYTQEANRIMNNALSANLRDLAQRGVEMTLSQYRAQIGL